ncbi:hypothetical protein K474DRAFT_1507715 [Panus rudis PR-1116 ss-1]|nr:hypothetical protein K474DRAFT_1507715 [Panus rudis PR-1116 ss-1]
MGSRENQPEPTGPGSKYYASRIHILHLNAPPHLHTPPSPLPSLQAYKTLIHHKTLHGPLLPNLHTFQWRDNAQVYDTLEPFVPAFAGYALRSLEVFSTPRCRDRYAESGPKFVEDLLGELYTLRRVSPFLRTFEHKLALLEFSASPSRSKTNAVSGCGRLGSGNGISRVIPSFANLTAYTCTKDFTYPEYLALSSLPSPESIYGDIAACLDLPSLLTQERPLEFRSLKTLVLNHAHDSAGADVGGLQILLSASRLPNLRKLALRWTRPLAFISALDKYDYDLLLRCLSTNCSHELLENIAIGVDSDKGIASADHSPISSRWTIDITTISILFTFRNLKRLVLTSRTTFFLGDNDLACLASAWPRLTELRLKELDPATLMHHSRPMLVGIVYLAQRCPDLKTLGLTSIPTTSESSSGSTITLLPATPWYHILRLREPHHHPTPPPKLTHLLFPSCPVDSPDRIAKFLHKYLPNLQAERIDNFSMIPSTYGGHGGGGVYGAASWVDVRAALRRLEERDGNGGLSRGSRG